MEGMVWYLRGLLRLWLVGKVICRVVVADDGDEEAGW